MARVSLLAGALSVWLTACGAAPDTTERHDGASLEILAVWQDAEADAFRAVLDRFASDTGASVTYTSTEGADIGAVLDERLDAGRPPDLAVLPQPGLLERYAADGAIVAVDDLVGDLVAASWSPTWRDLATVDGVLHGVWFKAANKSLIWYSLHAFEGAGAVPPQDLEELGAVIDQLGARGVPAFAVPGAPADAWTVTDWFENLHLRLAGPERYDDLAARRVPWTHPSVREALEAMAELLPAHAIVRTPELTFPGAVDAVFSPEPSAAMVMEGDFVPGVASDRAVEVGVDVDVFDFPGPTATDGFVVGGGDVVVLMRSSDGADALLRYLASPESAEIWARRGGFVSPNEDVDLRAYPDDTTRRIARSLLQAGDGFRFDLSDLQPVAFGGTTGGGMWEELDRFLDDPSDVEGTMVRLEAAAAAAWGS